MVTAVLVSHDGARWLPDALAGLLGQERPVQSVMAADTGSADDSAQLVTDALGADRVLHLARRTGFGQAVEEANRTAPLLTPDELPYLKRPSGWDPVTRTWRDDAYDMPELPYGEPVQWLWLLHDDSAPEPDALAQLLRVVDQEYELGRDDVAVVGPKLRGWYDRRQLLEVGVTIAHSGRRWTGLDRREQDQGQHDHVRPVLSVSTAGMLVRRDVFDELGGFDRRLPLMRDDVDLCWRATAVGHRVLVAPEAVVRHAEAASRERRRRLRGPHRRLPAQGRQGRRRLHPARQQPYGRAALGPLQGRRRHTAADRRQPRRQGPRTGARRDPRPPGDPVAPRADPRRTAQARRRPDRQGRTAAPVPAAGRDRAGHLRTGRRKLRRHLRPRDHLRGGPARRCCRVRTRRRRRGLPGDRAVRAREAHRPQAGPGAVPGAAARLLVACRGLLASGALTGGALLPAPGDSSELWSRFLDSWHPVGVGGTPSAPPYLAFVAMLSSLLFGSTGLAVTVLLVASVPLAGFTAYFASRPLVESRLLRAWAAVVYAFLPAATGALAGGHIGTAVLAVLLPLMARAGIAAGGLTHASGARGSWRATWAYALLLTVTTAFTPIIWPITLLLGVALLAVRRGDLVGYGPRFLAQYGTPLLILAPWSLTLLPFGFFQQAGLEYGSGSASPSTCSAPAPAAPARSAA